MLLLFGVCAKQNCLVDTTSGERQVNGEGQISHCSSREVLSLQLDVKQWYQL
jgi:hypothetical protein